MAELRQLPPEVLQSIARQIGERLRAGLSTTAVGPDSGAGGEDHDPLADFRDRASARFVMAETFEVWRLRAGGDEVLASTSEDLLTLGRPAGAWHHQIMAGTDAEGGAMTAVAFAQSRPVGAGDEWLVRDLFFSPLAGLIDRAIDLADEQVPDYAVTRLLSLPEFKLEALWFVTRGAAVGSPPGDAETPRRLTSQVMVISAPESFPGPLMTLISSSDFTSALASTRRGMGLLF